MYLLLKFVHLCAAAFFIGGVFFEVMILAALAEPFASNFSTMLTLKICLALSILGHFLAVVWLMRTGRMNPARSRLIHLSVLTQMILIIFLAKAMTILTW